MKKILLFSFLLFGFLSCSEDDIIRDFTNYSVEFSFEDSAMLDNETFLSNIVVTYEGKEYKYSKSEPRYNMPDPLAIRRYHSSHLDLDLLSFGEFSPQDRGKKKMEELTIDWGNGRVDNVKFKLYVKGKDKVKKELIVNGEKLDSWKPILISTKK